MVAIETAQHRSTIAVRARLGALYSCILTEMAGATATESYQEAEEDKEDAFDSGVEERTSSGKRKVVRKRRFASF